MLRPAWSPERARRFDPVGQALVMLVLGSVVYAIIESGRLGWTSPVILGLLAAAVLGVLGILGYEPRRADPLLELRLFRSVPFSAAIVMALCGLCAFGAFLFVTTLYLQDVRGLPTLTAGLCLLPVGMMIVVLSPLAGRAVGARGPRLPLVVCGAALALGGGASFWLGPATRLPAALGVYLLFGIAVGTINPPITNSAVSGMPASMAGVGRLAGLRRPADRHRPRRRDLRDDRGIGPGPRRGGLHRRGARRVVDGAGAGPGHLVPRAAQHRAPGLGYRRARGGTVRPGGPGDRSASRRCQPSMSAAATLAMCPSGRPNNWAVPCARLK